MEEYWIQYRECDFHKRIRTIHISLSQSKYLNDTHVKSKKQWAISDIADVGNITNTGFFFVQFYSSRQYLFYGDQYKTWTPSRPLASGPLLDHLLDPLLDPLLDLSFFSFPIICDFHARAFIESTSE